MKEFFEQCLKDLESLTGIRQLYYLEKEAGTDPTEAKRKMDICISGMVNVSEQFSYIPEEDQKRIITSMMTKDQEYDSLNSRIVWKWLNLYKDAFSMTPKEEEKPVEVAPPEVADKYIKQIQENIIKIGNPTDKLNNPVDQLKKELEGLAKKETGRQKFTIEGIEVWAVSETEAQKAFDATMK